MGSSSRSDASVGRRRPGVCSASLRRLAHAGEFATIATGHHHLTDDVLLLAKAAVGRIEDANDRVRMLVPNDDLPYQHAILDPCHRWFAVEIEHIEAMPPRYEMRCRVLDQGIDAPFIGFNRAKHAVIEAAILATRIGLIDEASLRSQLEQLRIPVEKTAGDDERAAWDLITSYVDRKLSQVSVNTST